MVKKYSFTDITVFAKTPDGEYLNITDYQAFCKENEYKTFQSDSPFLIAFHFQFCKIYEKIGQRPDICEATLEDLKTLTGQIDPSFWRRFKDSEKDVNEELAAIFCAWKIADYHSGKVIFNAEEGVYEFYRAASERVGNTYKKYPKLVLSKTFVKG